MARVVGVDVGASGIRAVEVTSGGHRVVRHAHAVPLPPSAVSDGRVTDRALVSTALRDLWRKGRFGTRDVALALGGNAGGVLHRSEPLAPFLDNPAHFAAIAAKAAKDALILPLDHLYFDHHVMSVWDAPTAKNPQERAAEVMFIGAERSLVDPLVGAVEDAGLYPVSVDTTQLALVRLVSAASSGPGLLDVVVHIGADTVTLVVAEAGQPVSVRNLDDYSGHKVTLQMQDAFNLRLDRAEQEKLNASRDLANGVDTAATSIVNAAVAATANEIRSLVGEIVSETGTPLGRVWLSGGGARLGDLVTRLARELNTNVAVIDPRSWTTKPGRLSTAIQRSGQDFTLALAAGGI